MKKICLIAALLVALAVLSACGASNVADPEPKEESSTSENMTEGQVPDMMPTVIETEPEPEYPLITIQDWQNVQGEYTDSVGNLYKYSYRFPEIVGAETDYINAINEELMAMYGKYVEGELASMEQGISLITLYADYDFSVSETENGPMYSIYFVLSNDWGQSMYRSYNLDAFGNELDNPGVLEACGLTMDSFMTALREQIAEEVAVPEEIYGTGMEKFFEEARDQTLSDENLPETLPIFVNSYGRVGAVVRLYTIAGAGAEDCSMLLTDKPFSEYEIIDLVAASYRRSGGSIPETIDVLEITGNEITVQCKNNDAQSPLDETYIIDLETGRGVHEAYGYTKNFAMNF